MKHQTDRDEMSPEEIVKCKTKLAYQTFYLVVLQACQDLEKKLESYGKELPDLR